MMIVIICILSIITFISIILSISYSQQLKQKIEIDKQTIEENKSLQNILAQLQKEVAVKQSICQNLEEQEEKDRTNLRRVQEELSYSFNNQKKLSEEAFGQYFEVLENKYKETEEEHDMEIDALNTAYSNLQLKLIAEIKEYQDDLDKIKATRTAAIEAQKREKEIDNNLSFYCIQLSDADKADIAKLDALKPSLNKPRVLSMLIWQTWFQKPLKTLSANIVGLDDKTGIYKITNIKTKECYVGQAVSIKDRWVEHAKCGLGIDTPANNKLYNAMKDFGLWNFSFEVLEECPRDQLNEKEKYYIDLYNSCDLGYNANRGIGK